MSESTDRSVGVAAGLVDELERRLLFGDIIPGQKLPAQRSLAQTYGVSRASVREAVCELQNRGLVETYHGGGSFSRNLLEADYPADQGASGTALQQQVMEMREMLEGEAAYFAALRATRSQRQALSREYGRMRERGSGETTLRKAKADLTFHMLIAESSHHLLVISISQVLYTKYFNAIYGVLAHTLRQTGRYPPGIGAQHEEIHRAVLAGDAEGARRAAREHIAYTRRQMGAPRPEPGT